MSRNAEYVVFDFRYEVIAQVRDLPMMIKSRQSIKMGKLNFSRCWMNIAVSAKDILVNRTGVGWDEIVHSFRTTKMTPRSLRRCRCIYFISRASISTHLRCCDISNSFYASNTFSSFRVLFMIASRSAWMPKVMARGTTQNQRNCLIRKPYSTKKKIRFCSADAAERNSHFSHLMANALWLLSVFCE